jgi:hypothetical protein
MRILRQILGAVWPAGRGDGLRLRTLFMEILVAVSLALLAWIYTRSREESSLDHIEVPVKLTLAPGIAGKYELQINGTSRIPMSFTGPPAHMRELRRQIQRGQLQVNLQVSVSEENISENTYHDVARVEPDCVPVPPGVITVLAEGHNGINYTLHKLAERHLPVQLDYSGELKISQIKLEPATVMVRGPKEVLDRARAISTQPYNITLPADAAGRTAFQEGQASLAREIDGRAVQTTPASISFRFKVHSPKKIYTLTDVPVRFLCPADFAWLPRFADPRMSKISVKVRGPAGDEPPTVTAFIDLTGADLCSGRNVLPLRIHVPPEFQLVNDAPRLIGFHLDPFDQTTIR